MRLPKTVKKSKHTILIDLNNNKKINSLTWQPIAKGEEKAYCDVRGEGQLDRTPVYRKLWRT